MFAVLKIKWFLNKYFLYFSQTETFVH